MTRIETVSSRQDPKEAPEGGRELRPGGKGRGAIGLGALIAGLVILIAACKPGEGERCNPLFFTDECGQGMMCTNPANCAVAYCCRVTGDAGTIISTTPNCQACPGPDMATAPDMAAAPDMAQAPLDMAGDARTHG